MEIVTRKEAQERGDVTYFTGEPCGKGHIAKRSVSNRACYGCRAEANKKRKYWREEKHKKTASQYRKNNPVFCLMEGARNRAKKKGIPFELDYSDIIIPEFCPILGIPLFRNEGKTACPNSPSLDRVNPDLGYVKGNVQVISHRANTIKNDASIEELLAVVEYIRSHMSSCTL